MQEIIFLGQLAYEGAASQCSLASQLADSKWIFIYELFWRIAIRKRKDEK